MFAVTRTSNETGNVGLSRCQFKNRVTFPRQVQNEGIEHGSIDWCDTNGHSFAFQAFKGRVSLSPTAHSSTTPSYESPFKSVACANVEIIFHVTG